MEFDSGSYRLLIFYLRQARRKAREAATREALCLLRDLDPAALPGGPLSEQGGLLWIGVPAGSVQTAITRLPRLGYSHAVELLEPMPAGRTSGQREHGERLTRWRGKQYELMRVYEEDPEAERERQPDRRVFLLETPTGEVRSIRGYRGDGMPLSRRGLPVCDARLLVNLVHSPGGGAFLDPFAGIGGLVLEAVESGWSVSSADIDPALRPGLQSMGSRHVIADARRLPFDSAAFDAIATEPPYDREAEDLLAPALREMHRVLRPGGRLAIMCARWQAETLRREGAALALSPYLDSPIDRKGTDVVVLAWEKPLE